MVITHGRRGSLRRPGFAEDMLVVDTARPAGDWAGGNPAMTPTTMVLEALTLGVRDYLHKTGFRSQRCSGLSGGIDSAVTAAIACRALGAGQVLAVALPSPYTSPASIDDARQLAANLGCRFEIHSR